MIIIVYLVLIFFIISQPQSIENQLQTRVSVLYPAAWKPKHIQKQTSTLHQHLTLVLADQVHFQYLAPWRFGIAATRLPRSLNGSSRLGLWQGCSEIDEEGLLYQVIVSGVSSLFKPASFNFVSTTKVVFNILWSPKIPPKFLLRLYKSCPQKVLDLY